MRGEARRDVAPSTRASDRNRAAYEAHEPRRGRRPRLTFVRIPGVGRRRAVDEIAELRHAQVDGGRLVQRFESRRDEAKVEQSSDRVLVCDVVLELDAVGVEATSRH